MYLDEKGKGNGNQMQECFSVVEVTKKLVNAISIFPFTDGKAFACFIPVDPL